LLTRFSALDDRL